MTAAVTVHTKPSCVQCKATFRKLDDHGVTYDIVQLTDESAMDFKAQGFASAPIVITPTETWAGFRPDRINELFPKEQAA